MARASRGSKSSKTPKTPAKGKNVPPAEKQPSESRRKSLRSCAKVPSPTSSKTPSDSSPAPKTPVATRSTRKRLSVSSDDQEEQKVVSPQVEKSAKRRRIAASTPPSLEQPSKPTGSTSASVRKRRGAQMGSPTTLTSPSPAPATKRAKVASPAAAIFSTSAPSNTPKTRSAAVMKRRHRQKSSSESEANQSEKEEDKKSTPSQSSKCSTQQKRGAKRSRKASVKSPSPVVEPKKTVGSAKKLTPLRSHSAKTKTEEVVVVINQESENGGKEITKEKSPVKKELVKLKKRDPIKPPLTKREIEALERKLLFSRLDHDDLSDLISISGLLSKWPEAELRNPVTDSSVLQVIPASHRLWVSGETNQVIVNGDSQVPLTRKESAELEAPRVKRPRRSISPESNGEGGGGELQKAKVSAVEVISEVDHHPRLLDTFCVASFTISPSASEEHGDLEGEFSQLLAEITAIIPDVFCIKQIPGSSAATYLKSEFDSHGYQCSGCSGTGGAAQSFIFFNRDVFTEVSTHRRSVQSMARNLVEQSAYPQLWRDTLTESLAPVTGAGDASNQSQLLVSVLRHTSTGSLLLFGCLTDRHQNENGDIFHSSVLPDKSTNTSISIPHVEGGCVRGCTSTITVSVAGCHSPKSVSPADALGCEWCPRTLGSRPDLAAIDATGCIWALKDVWDEVQNSIQSPVNGGFNGHSPVPTMRWVLCANLEASPTSPVYQILRDGYPSDESITRLRAMRNVHLKDHDFFDATTLLDRLWPAFQHTCTDVCSCYQSVMGIEPPFTRYSTVTSSTDGSNKTKTTAGVEPRKCVDYIFCSGSSLHPRQVLIPPCRATLRSIDSSNSSSAQSHEIVFSLASKIGIVEMNPESSLSAKPLAISS